MTEPERPRRSRIAWPGPTSVAGLEPGHEHFVPEPLTRRIRHLTRVVVVLAVCLLVIGTSFMLILLDRGKLRAEEDARIREEIRNSWCVALDSLPEGGLLDGLRAKYECGPGIPIDKLPPDIAEQLRRTPTPEPAPAATPTGPKEKESP